MVSGRRGREAADGRGDERMETKGSGVCDEQDGKGKGNVLGSICASSRWRTEGEQRQGQEKARGKPIRDDKRGRGYAGMRLDQGSLGEVVDV